MPTIYVSSDSGFRNEHIFTGIYGFPGIHLYIYVYTYVYVYIWKRLCYVILKFFLLLYCQWKQSICVVCIYNCMIVHTYILVCMYAHIFVNVQLSHLILGVAPFELLHRISNCLNIFLIIILLLLLSAFDYGFSFFYNFFLISFLFPCSSDYYFLFNYALSLMFIF